MRLDYETIEELIEAAGLALRGEDCNEDADTEGDVMKTTPGDAGRQSHITITIQEER